MQVGHVFHLAIHVRVRENVAALDELVIPDVGTMQLLGDERAVTHAAGGTDAVETLTLQPSQTGAFTFRPAYLDAIDAATGKPSRFSSNPVRVEVVRPSAAAAPRYGAFAQRAVEAVLVVLGAIAVVLGLRALARLRRARARSVAHVAPPLAAPAPAPATPPRALRDEVADALRAYRVTPAEPSLRRLRAALFTAAGTNGGSTLGDALGATSDRGAAGGADRSRAGSVRSAARARRCLARSRRRGGGVAAVSRPRDVLDALHATIVGQNEVCEALVLALIAGGHVLLEGAPGVAKTLACRALAAAVGGAFRRVQFTPDLLPSDIVGTRVFDQKTADFTTVLGPLFANVVLADEINRAPAKVQSALLEGMQERRVTIGPRTHDLPAPFVVLATMNPYDSDGTYPLPHAQLDRFLAKVVVSYPSLRRRAHDRRPLRRRRAAAADRDRDDGRRADVAARGARDLRRCGAARLRRRARPRDARRRARRARREPARRARARRAGPRACLSRRTKLRRARRRARRRAVGAPPSPDVRRPHRDRRRRSGGDRPADRRRGPRAVNPLRAAILRGARAAPRAGTAVRGARPGDGFVFSQLRAYVEGDDPRRIDHAATARSGALQTRVYLEETALVLGAIVDESGSMQVGRRRPLADAAHEALHAWFGAAEGEDAVARVVDERVVRDRRAVALVARGGAVPLRERPGDRAACAAARRLAARDRRRLRSCPLTTRSRCAALRFDATALLARDPWRDDLPLRGVVRLRDAETGAVRRVYVGARERRRYREAAHAREAALHARFRDAGWRTGALEEADGRGSLLRAFGLAA